MKKTCNGCRAFERHSGRNGGHCQLGYEVEDVFNVKTGSFIESKPLDECPKPKTVSDYMFHFKNSKKI